MSTSHQYRFCYARPPYSKGDLVPQGVFGKGEIQTMLDYNRIEVVPPKPYAPVSDPAKEVGEAESARTIDRNRKAKNK